MTTPLDIKQLFSPSASDVKYTQDDQLKISLICRIDSYKFTHPFAYPKEKNGNKIVAMSSYGEARVSHSVTVVPFGIQLLIKRYLTQKITMADIDAAEAFALAHFGRPLFRRAAWEKVVNTYGGSLPLVIRSVPEGTVLHGGLPLYNVTCFDDELFWMSAGFETLIQRGVWYPTTIASMDWDIKQQIKQEYIRTGADLNMLPFALHDFGGRGVTSAESAEIGGAAHLANFMGSDTVEGILTANFYYKHQMSAFSVYATEHSIECSFGGGTDEALAYIRHQLATAKELGIQIISVVLDGYDVDREAELCCTVLRDEIIASGIKVVFRPDSGNMNEVVPRLLDLQAKAFGTTIIEGAHGLKYKSINHVGIIQGDGVDHASLMDLLRLVAFRGYCSHVVIFGSGGALLQKLNRDTLKFAQKASALLTDGGWVGIAKDPVTDQGKKSKEGVMTTVRNKVTGEFMAARLDNIEELNEDLEDIMQLVYYYGDLYNETTLDEVRSRTA
jgi:nicotinamide phosphoribosyltransferase